MKTTLGILAIAAQASIGAPLAPPTYDSVAAITANFPRTCFESYPQIAIDASVYPVQVKLYFAEYHLTEAVVCKVTELGRNWHMGCGATEGAISSDRESWGIHLSNLPDGATGPGGGMYGPNTVYLEKRNNDGSLLAAGYCPRL